MDRRLYCSIVRQGFFNKSIFISLVALTVPTFADLCVAQDPLPVLGSGWQRSVRKADDPAVQPSGPARVLTVDDKNFTKKAREQRTDNPLSPDKDSIDARSAAMERNIQESRMPKASDVSGYNYSASVRNDSGKTVKVIFWEYRFTEIARPSNVVRRQFLCSVNLKKGSRMDLAAFSILAPSDTIDAESLAKSTEKLFDEHVQINRIEFSDDSVLQRGGWKLDDVKSSIDRVTSTPWRREVCRVL